jgi:hypothetical protein
MKITSDHIGMIVRNNTCNNAGFEVVSVEAEFFTGREVTSGETGQYIRQINGEPGETWEVVGPAKTPSERLQQIMDGYAACENAAVRTAVMVVGLFLDEEAARERKES